MSHTRTTAGKRQRQQQKLEKAQAKVERRAARQAADPADGQAPVDATESELIEELAQFHHDFEAGRISHDELEDRRERIRQQLEEIRRLES